MTTGSNVVAVAGDGSLEGILIRGFHGVVDPQLTPARREPILVDEKRRIVNLLHVDTGEAGRPTSVIVDRSRPLPKGGSVPGEATEIPLVRSRLGDMALILGPRDVQAIGESDLPDRRSRAGDLVIAICSDEEAVRLCEGVALKAIEAVHSAVSSKNLPGLVRAAWWLSRATATPARLAIAVAALLKAGSPHAELLRREAFRGQEPVMVDRMIETAGQNLAPRPELEARHRVRAAGYSRSQCDDKRAA